MTTISQLFKIYKKDAHASMNVYKIKADPKNVECFLKKTHLVTDLTMLLSLFISNSSHLNCDSSITVLSPRLPQERIM